VHTYAGPVVITDVTQVVRNDQNVDLRLRSASQDNALRNSVVHDSLQSSVAADRPSSQASDSLFASLAISQDPQRIDVIAQDDVEGTICDCADVFVPAGGWPKWPLLLLGAIPFFFIDHDCDNCDSSTPTPTPTPTTPTPTPEPGSLFLLGTGLAAVGAAVRRRYSHSRLIGQMRSMKEG